MTQTFTEQKEIQANLLDHIGQAVMMVDTNHKISFWNAASEKLFGYTKPEALGKDAIEVLAGSNAKDDYECMSKWLNAQETQTQEYLAQRKDGSLVPLLINRSSVYDWAG